MGEWVFVLTLFGYPQITMIHSFLEAADCQMYRATYIDTHPSDPSKWSISKCKYWERNKDE
jgi:hypothetical protein